MLPSRSDRHTFRRALAVSVALHLCAALLVATGVLLPLGSGTLQSGGRAFETTHVSYLTIERRAAPHVHRASPAHETVAFTVQPTTARAAASRARAERPKTAHFAQALRPSMRAFVTATPPRLVQVNGGAVIAAAARSEPRPVTLAPRLTLPRAPASAAPLATQAASPAPSESATPGPAKAPASEEIAARGLDVPPGGWGQSFERPLVADESAVDSLRSRYHSAAAVRVEVDDSGRAIHVSVPPGLSDDLRAELERKLLELRYVPAECNGLRCTGVLQIVI